MAIRGTVFASRSGRAIGLAAALAIASNPTARAGDEPSKPNAAPGVAAPGDAYAALVREYRDTESREDGERAALKTDDERAAYGLAHWPLQDRFVGRFLDAARTHAGQPSAFDALAWVAVFGYTSNAAEEAATLLARDHAADPRLWTLCEEMGHGLVYPARGILLRAVLGASPGRDMQGRACFALADYLAEEAAFVRLLRTPGLEPWTAQFFPGARLDRLRSLDPDGAAREASALFERTIREFADVHPARAVRRNPPRGDVRNLYDSPPAQPNAARTLAASAAGALEVLRTLDVGKVAPEIAGPDVNGVPMGLADFRGKVVLLTFSGEWCGPCRAMYEHERELVKKFQGRPFAMGSVNSDETKEQLLRAMADGSVAWRCWWEPRDHGPIADRYHVRGWPTVYILDHHGVIRVKFVGFVGRSFEGQPPIDDALEALIRDAEKTATPPRP